jgi:hypothetical protein
MTQLRRGNAIIIAGLCAACGALAHGDVPIYSTFELKVRANFCVNPSGSYNLPCNVFFANATPAMNDDQQIAIKLDVLGSSQGIWFGDGKTGEIVYTSPADAILSDPTINSNGYVVFPQALSPQNGIYFFDHGAGTNGFLTSTPIGSSTWGAPTVNDAGEVGYRAGFSGPQAYYSYDGSPNPALHAFEAGINPSSPYSFLFTPAFNNKRQIAAHVRLGAAGQTGNNQPDQIRVFNSDGSSILIAEDLNSNAASPYSAFDSSRPALMDDGSVAFIANLVAGGRGVFLSDGVNTITIATTAGSPGLSVIEFFPPSVNSSGMVAFRGRDSSDLDAVFVGDGATLRRVIGEHDIVPTDQGPGRIDQHDNSVTFGGSVSINNHGDIAFHCTLAPPDNNQIEWGSGIFIAIATPPTTPGDITGDGVVDVDDLLAVINAWGKCSAPPGKCAADIAPEEGDGVVDVDDLLVVINNWS